MKKREIWISIGIVAAAVALLFSYFRGEGRVEIDAGGAAVALQMRNNLFMNTTITSGPEPASAVAGVYRPKRLSLSMDQNGQTWRLNSRGPWMNLSRIRVQNLRTTALKLGPPLLVRPKVHRNGSAVDIDFLIVCRAGERYQTFATKDNREVRKAKVRIVDETGKILKAGSVRYG